MSQRAAGLESRASAARPGAIRVANFMDSTLAALEAKGNLAEAPSLYNPGKVAERVVHFTPSPEDLRYAPLFAPWGIEIFPYLDPAERGPRLWRVLHGFLRVLSRIREERLTLVRGRLPYLGSLFGCLAGRRLGLPSVVSLGGDNRLSQRLSGEYPFRSRLLANAVEWLVLRLCDVVVAPNLFTKRYVAGIIGPRRAEAKVRVIPWRVGSRAAPPPADPAEALSRLSLDPNRPLLLVVGFLNRYKHTDVMFEVASWLAAQAPGRAQLVFCGDGPLRPEGEARFDGRREVRFLGWQPRDVVQALLRAATVVLVPMSGFVLLEAASEGKAVIAADLEWHSELVEDGATGLLVPARDVEAWVKAIEGLLSDDARRAELGGRLKARFDAEYHPQLAEKLEVDLYRSLTQRAGG